MTEMIEGVSNGISAVLNKNQVLVKIPIILVLVLFLTETVLWYLNISSSISTSWYALYCLTFIGIIELIIAAASLLAGIKHIVHGRYKSALSLILLSVVLLLVFFVPVILMIANEKRNVEYHNGYPYDLANFIKFTLHEKQYLEEIKATQPDEKGYRYKSFLWAGAQGDGTELVYDESDALGSAAPPRTFGWWRKTWEIQVAKENVERANASAAEEVCRYHVYKIKGHFYAVRFTCGF
jgi:phage shock protein PspC (stress-responsive transcriptional regulator)